jgi:hypothetical protein
MCYTTNLVTVDILGAKVLTLTWAQGELVFLILAEHKRETTQKFHVVETDMLGMPKELFLLHTLELLSRVLHTLLDLITARVQTERMVVLTPLTILVLLAQG